MFAKIKWWGLFIFLFISCSDLKDTPVQEIRKRKVLFIGIDGVNVDILEQTKTPHIDALIADGLYNNNISMKGATRSAVGWTNIFTGWSPQKHKVRNEQTLHNDYWRGNREYQDIFWLLRKANQDLKLFFSYSWFPLHYFASAADMLISRLNIEQGVSGQTEADEYIVEQTLAALASTDVNYDVLFCYIALPDAVAHQYGPSVGANTWKGLEAYSQAIKFVDESIGKLLAAIKKRPYYKQEEWLMIVTTDHGIDPSGISHTYNPPAARKVFYIISGKLVRTGRSNEGTQESIAPTILSYMGGTITSEMGLKSPLIRELIDNK
ncbi:MAG: alkaline phosphatase family protein [Spirochaetota bacterium]